MTDIIVLMSEELFNISSLRHLGEGIWKPAPGGAPFECRVDPARPQMKVQPHVHVRMRGYADRTHEMAWNRDGTRHDRHSTGSNFRGVGQAKDVVRSVLGLPKTAKLEETPRSAVLEVTMQLLLESGGDADLIDGIFLVAS